MSDLQTADTLAHLKKNLLKAEELSGYSEYSREDGYSRRNDGRHYMGESYDDSYARGRGRNANRDSMGRYSTSDVRHDLTELMDKAQDQHTKEELRKLIERM
jgi:hypothetical protein